MVKVHLVILLLTTMLLRLDYGDGQEQKEKVISCYKCKGDDCYDQRYQTVDCEKPSWCYSCFDPESAEGNTKGCMSKNDFNRMNVKKGGRCRKCNNSTPTAICNAD